VRALLALDTVRRTLTSRRGSGGRARPSGINRRAAGRL